MTLGLFACQEKPIEFPKPDSLLPEAKIIPILIDLQILESHYHRLYSRPDVYKGALDSSSYFVFENHGTNRKEFRESYNYYAYDVNKMYAIYEATLDSINFKVSQSTDLPEIQE